MKKRLIIQMLAIFLLLSACGGNSADDELNLSANVSQETQENAYQAISMFSIGTFAAISTESAKSSTIGKIVSPYSSGETGTWTCTNFPSTNSYHCEGTGEYGGTCTVNAVKSTDESKFQFDFICDSFEFESDGHSIIIDGSFSEENTTTSSSGNAVMTFDAVTPAGFTIQVDDDIIQFGPDFNITIVMKLTIEGNPTDGFIVTSETDYSVAGILNGVNVNASFTMTCVNNNGNVTCNKN